MARRDGTETMTPRSRKSREDTEPLTDKILESVKKTVAKTKVRQRLADGLAPGLRVNVYPDGKVALSVEYRLPGIITRPQVKFGEWPDMSIDEARELAGIVRELASRGVDVQLGLHTRLAKELQRDGLDWQPALAPPPTRKRAK
jgi:hypothetical protein